ncbi:MAG: Fic family protein [Candidatus Methanoplasma sp.]|jgi:Fic family protein|nr:Fic family protein [Candidatus Methanoplasma sp.]
MRIVLNFGNAESDDGASVPMSTHRPRITASYLIAGQGSSPARYFSYYMRRITSIFSEYYAENVSIHQRDNWTDFKWDDTKIIPLLGETRYLQGRLSGQMHGLGFPICNEILIDIITSDVSRSSEIEGELLVGEQVRSSVARHLGLKTAGAMPSAHNIEGIVSMMIDATQNYSLRLTEERLLDWHRSLFSDECSGRNAIAAGEFRKGEVSVVSGVIGKEKIHYEAPEASKVYDEMKKFIEWINEDPTDPVIKSAVAHVWFVLIHPFNDGNGRIARAISDMLLARSEYSQKRFYSMSSRILKERRTYYDILDRVGRGDGEITEWIEWYISCIKRAILDSENTLGSVLFKDRFWKKHAQTSMNDRQRKVLNMLIDGFEGKLTSTKWAKVTKCSDDTALRDIQDLIGKNILSKGTGGGRSTDYILSKDDDLT